MSARKFQNHDVTALERTASKKHVDIQWRCLYFYHENEYLYSKLQTNRAAQDLIPISRMVLSNVWYVHLEPLYLLLLFLAAVQMPDCDIGRFTILILLFYWRLSLFTATLSMSKIKHIGGKQIRWSSRNHLKILGAGRATTSRFHPKDPQLLDATNFSRPWFIHP
jgi:hypothetical protein